jgi:nucleotide-binding universal stress UspA family protein
MKTILLPTDFSENSINAIHYATDLFKDVPCNFYILNVQKVSSFISDNMMLVSSSATIYNSIIDEAKKSISNIISNIEAKYNNSNHTFYSIVDYDNFIDSINQVSKKYEVDLIVMGTNGASGFGKMIFGSNTVRVMQRCNVPVLAIPNHYKFLGLNKIAFTTNHQTLFKAEELSTLSELLKLYNPKFNILHLADENHLAQKQDENTSFFATYFPNAQHEYIDSNSKEMFNAVHEFINYNDIEMLAMMHEKHSFLERLFTQHAVETFAFSINVPFLVL